MQHEPLFNNEISRLGVSIAFSLVIRVSTLSSLAATSLIGTTLLGATGKVIDG
jgi:hypothetical protein